MAWKELRYNCGVLPTFYSAMGLLEDRMHSVTPAMKILKGHNRNNFLNFRENTIPTLHKTNIIESWSGKIQITILRQYPDWRNHISMYQLCIIFGWTIFSREPIAAGTRQIVSALRVFGFYVLGIYYTPESTLSWHDLTLRLKIFP